MKRFVRDYMHYNDSIFCAAGKIVRSIQQEAMERGFSLDEEGGGGYSSLHVRRGDLQYKEVLLSEDLWYVQIVEVMIQFCVEMISSQLGSRNCIKARSQRLIVFLHTIFLGGLIPKSFGSQRKYSTSRVTSAIGCFLIILQLSMSCAFWTTMLTWPT